MAPRSSRGSRRCRMNPRPRCGTRVSGGCSTRTAARWRAEREEIRLGDRDVDALAHPSPPPLPDAFAVMARVAAGTTRRVRDG